MSKKNKSSKLRKSENLAGRLIDPLEGRVLFASHTGSNGSNVTIPDAGSFVSSTINISGAPAGAVVTGVDVTFAAVHPFSGDLNVDLNADAQGTSGNYDLWAREGGAADNPSRTRTGISTFNGLSVNRTWYLYARDETAGDGGYIDTWSITVHYNNTCRHPVAADARLAREQRRRVRIIGHVPMEPVEQRHRLRIVPARPDDQHADDDHR